MAVADRVRELIVALDLDPNDVCRVVLTPRQIEATVFVRNLAGEKFIDEGKPAVAVVRFDSEGRRCR